MRLKISHFISIGGILSAFAVLFQLSPAILPGVGLILSPMTTLPIAIAASLSFPLGFLTLLASAPIVFIFSPEECMIMLLTTGPFGIALGSVVNRSKPAALLWPVLTLFTGMNLLTYVVQIAAFGDLTASFTIPVTLLAFIFFSFIYTILWKFLLEKILKRIFKISFINSFFSDK